MFNYQNIPEELKKLKQFVCWSADKLPKNPYTGGNAQSNNPETWSDFETAVKAVDKYLFEGIGFMFNDNGYFGVDLDAHHGQVLSSSLKKDFLEGLNSYTEVSKSGEGLHIICKGELPSGARRKGQVEMYQTGRYFIMTGNIVGDYTDLSYCTEKIKPLHAKYLEPKQEKDKMLTRGTPISLSESEVLEKARASKQGTQFQVLFNGNWQGFYDSQSEADMAFCNMLAFWCGKDTQKMDNIFRSSQLMREKWNRRQSGSTYGEITLEKACANCSEVYSNLTRDIPEVPYQKESGSTKTYAPTDSGNGQRLADTFRNQIKFSNINNVWYFWTGKVWQVDTTKYIKLLADETIKKMKIEAFAEEDDEKQKEKLKFVNATQSTGKKKAMIEEASHLQGVAIGSNEFDRYPDFINLQNGIVSLKNGEMIDHSPSYMQSKIVDIEKRTGEPKRWLQFLEEVTCGDKELQRYLKRAVGYTMTGSTEEQCVFFLYGMGGNGKSIFVDTISKIFGNYAVNIQPEVFMSNNSASQETQIARLEGVRLCTSAEFREGLLNESLIKQLTGGGMVSARHLYGKPFDFEPEFKLWVTTNNKPIIKGTDNGIWRRMRLIPFLANIPKEKQDKKLMDKLQIEFPEILNWAIEGAIEWSANGLGKTPDVIEQATKEYRQEMDVLNSFLEDCCDPVNGFAEPASKIFKAYSTWCKDNNEFEMSNTKFGREMSKRFDRKKTASGAVYQNIMLKASKERTG